MVCGVQFDGMDEACEDQFVWSLLNLIVIGNR